MFGSRYNINESVLTKVYVTEVWDSAPLLGLV